jgi:hypothetical protein
VAKLKRKAVCNNIFYIRQLGCIQCARSGAFSPSTQGLAVLNSTRAAASLPVVTVDLALHVGEVLYGDTGQ